MFTMSEITLPSCYIYNIPGPCGMQGSSTCLMYKYVAYNVTAQLNEDNVNRRLNIFPFNVR